MHWIDITVIAVLVILSIIGLAKGLFESILSIFGTGLSLFVAIWASKPVTVFVNKIVNVSQLIENFLVKNGQAQNGIVKIKFIIETEFPVAQVANFLATVGTVVALFILIKIAIWILSRIFDSATTNNSAISGLNRILGLVFGFAKGVLTIAVVLGGVSLVSKVAFTNEINAQLQNAPITNFVYKQIDPWVSELAENQIKKLFGDPATQEPDTDTGVEEAPVIEG